LAATNASPNELPHDIASRSEGMLSAIRVSKFPALGPELWLLRQNFIWRQTMNIRKHNKIHISLLLILTMSLISCSLVGTINDQFRQVVDPVPPAESNPTPTATPVLEPETTNALETIQEGFSSVYARVLPSVVNIQVEQSVGQPEMGQFPFDFPGGDGEFRRSGLGSGFIWDQKGHIVTNNHVVQNAERIVVTFHDGTSVEGEVIGTDRDSDLAVVKADHPGELPPPVQLADSTKVKVGQLVAAIGNPFGLQGTMTTGIISALGRSLPVEAQIVPGSSYTIPDVIQTDAPINPGNSGGVLVDIHGQLVGVPTAIESSSGVNAGIGFVVPSVIVSKVVPALIEEGSYEHPWLGISGTSLNSDLALAMNLPVNQRGVLVVNVVPDSPAERAGIIGSDRLETINGQEIRLGGDVIIEIDSQPIQDFEDLTAYLARHTEAGQIVTLTILRDERQESLDLKLGVRPTSEPVATPESPQELGNAWLGIQGTTLTAQIAEAMDLSTDQEGVLIQEVLEGSPADQAGLRGSYKSVTINGSPELIGGDIIIRMNGQPVTSTRDLERAIGEHQPGDVVTLGILRDGDEMEVEVTLGKTS
jgi:2-alkenal reductase